MTLIEEKDFKTITKKINCTSISEGCNFNLTVEIDTCKNLVVDYTVTSCSSEWFNHSKRKLYTDKRDFYSLSESTRKELDLLIKYELLELRQKGEI